MKELVIIGAGGFARNVFWQCNSDNHHQLVWTIKGFLDDRTDILNDFPVPRDILGSPYTYEPQSEEIYLCALGKPAMRRKYAAPLIAKGAHFINLCSEVGLPSSVKLGRGIIFEPKVQVGSDTTIGDFSVLLSLCVVGHDVTIGEYAQISSLTFIAARVNIGNDVQVHPHSTILPGVNIGDRAIVGAGSVVLRDVPADTTVFGNPAKIVFKH